MFFFCSKHTPLITCTVSMLTYISISLSLSAIFVCVQSMCFSVTDNLLIKFPTHLLFILFESGSVRFRFVLFCLFTIWICDNDYAELLTFLVLDAMQNDQNWNVNNSHVTNVTIIFMIVVDVTTSPTYTFFHVCSCFTCVLTVHIFESCALG